MKKKVITVSKLLIICSVTIFLVHCKSSKTASSKTKTNTSTATTKAESVSPRAFKVIKEAKSYMGTKYKFGGMSKSGVDCSGLMCKSFECVGVTLPRTTRSQSVCGKRVYIGELQPGDLVFFATSSSKSKITHVGLVTERTKSKDIKFIHASTSKGVREDFLSQDYWKKRYIKGIRPLK